VSDRSLQDESARAHYLACFADLRTGNDLEAGGGGGWLGSLRQEAIERFVELGFPSRRLEEWRYTNVAPIAKLAFIPASGTGDPGALDPEALGLPDFGGTRLVFVDGFFAEHASRLSDDPALEFQSLAQSSPQADRVQGSSLAHYGTLVEAKDDGFAALNTAFATDGAVVTFKRGRALANPLQIVFVSSGNVSSGDPDVAAGGESQPRASFPRVLIVAEPGSEGVIVQDHISLAAATSLSCAVSEIVLEEDASLKMILMQRESDATYHIACQRVRQQRNSRFSHHSLNLGGAILRNELDVVLADEGAACELDGLYLGRDRQLVDNHTLVDHAMPHCQSRELYKGILADRSRGVFRGRVIVRPNAQHTAAEQQNRNLLLSRGAEVDTKPQLEIYADDVKCNHGSSIGQLDEEALFFLRSRGLDESVARAFLTTGFAAQITESIGSEHIRVWATAVVDARLETLFDAGESP
jgi:Fe-S cluster assembly protein SufD